MRDLMIITPFLDTRLATHVEDDLRRAFCFCLINLFRIRYTHTRMGAALHDRKDSGKKKKEGQWPYHAF